MKTQDFTTKAQMPAKKLKEALKELDFNIDLKSKLIDDDLAHKALIALRDQRRKKRLVKQGVEIKEEEDIAAKKVALPSIMTVRELADKLELPVPKVISELIKNGIMATINEDVDFETASIITEDLGYTVIEDTAATTGEESNANVTKNIKAELKKEKESNLESRPPIVTILGHVDHGKTTLLDAIRETSVAASEHGGITQHIGAYQAQINDKLITFLDTPGHEAFASMRSRGARVTDIAILIVAADDGVQPQTIEAIEHAKKAEVPIVVAVNKIDKEGANVEKIKKQLADYDLIPEEWGGKTIFAEISAKQKQGIKELLDMILLVADVENLIANPNAEAIGTVIESHVNPKQGALATILIQNGTLYKGESAIVGRAYGTIRAIKNSAGAEVDEAGPAMPVQVMGLNRVPEVGDAFRAVKSMAELKSHLAKQKHLRLKNRLGKQKEDLKKLNIIIKADVQGSLEAISESLAKLENDEVIAQIISEGVGAVNESDITMAVNTNSLVIGFNSEINPLAEQLAREKKVDFKNFNVIYELLDYIKAEMSKLLVPEVTTKKLGQLETLAVFHTDKDKMTIGGRVIDGELIKNASLKIFREGEEVGRGKITGLQKDKADVNKVSHGNECGLKFAGSDRIKVGDILEAFEEKTTVKKI
ncbi:MAG: translation initiation factor IF-2 [bacterium]